MRLTLTIGDQAAMILLRETFLSLAKRQANRLESLSKHPEAIQGWAKLIEPVVRDKKSPFNRIRIQGPTGTEVPFEFAFYDIQNLTSIYQQDEKSIREWATKSRNEAFQNYLSGLQNSIQQADDAKDCELEKLLRLTGYGFDAVAQHLLPRLMKPSKTAEGIKWVPDLPARSNVANLYLLGAAFRAQEEVSELDTTLVGICFAAASIPALFSGSLGYAIAALASDLADVVLVSADRVPAWIQESRELEFARGAAEILGTERLDEAEMMQTALWEKVLEVGGVGIGSIFDGFDVLKAYKALTAEKIRKTGRRLLEKIRNDKLKGLTDLPLEERLEFLAYLSEARQILAKRGSSALTKEQQDAVNLFNELEAAARNIDRIPSPPRKDFLAKVPVENGAHNVALTASGRIVRCSDCELIIQSLRKEYADVLQASPEAAKLLESLERRAFRSAIRGTIDPNLVAEEAVNVERTLAQLRESFLYLDNKVDLPPNFEAENFFGNPVFRTREQAANDIAEQTRRYEDLKRTLDYASSDEVPYVVRSEMSNSLRNTRARRFTPTAKSPDRYENIQKGIDEALEKLTNIVKNPDLEKEILKIPGTAETLADIARGGTKEKGGTYVVQLLERYIRRGEGVRVVEDTMPGLPKYRSTTDPKGREIKQASDFITEDGIVVQAKCYENYSEAISAIKRQVLSDLIRYGDQGWKDGTGKDLKKVFRYYIDKNELRKSGQLNPDRIAAATQEAETLTALVNRVFKTNQQIKIEIKIE